MIGVNKVILVGRVASDVDCRTTKTGRNLAKFSIAIPRRNSQGGAVNGESTADFFDVTAWNRTAETCGKYVKKGEKIYIEGRLSRSVWENGDGEKRSRVEVSAQFVNFLGSKGSPAPADDEELAEAETPESAEAAA